MTTRLLDTVEARLRAHAEALHLTHEQETRARSLAVAGTVGALLGITPAELFALLQPAFARWLETQQPYVDVESEVQ